MKSIDLKMSSGIEAHFSYQQGLIMLHTDDISAQWHPDKVGVMVDNHGSYIKVGFQSTQLETIESYQSFHFAVGELEEILSFFRGLGFPCQLPKVIHVK